MRSDMNKHQVLNFADHGGLRVHTEADAQFGDGVMACITGPGEFRLLQTHFPIVFRRDSESGKFSALALLGFEAGENLFLEGGLWDAAYRPLALSIQPFLVGRPGAGGGAPQVHIDAAHPRISTTGEGVRLFDDQGRPSPYLESMAEKLGDLDQIYNEGPAFFSLLEQYDLIEPFSLEVPLKDGSQHSLVGYHTIDERRLASLDATALGRLNAEGWLMPLFMAVASLSRFSDLVARKNRRMARGV
jgi:hypothetical protein